jgi:hypothetical protein
VHRGISRSRHGPRVAPFSKHFSREYGDLAFDSDYVTFKLNGGRRRS